MCKKICLLIITLVLSDEIVLGKNGNNLKNIKNTHKKSDKKNVKVNNERGKRSLGAIEKSFLTHLESKSEKDDLDSFGTFANEGSFRNVGEKKEDELPFWGTRGRRDSSSESAEYIHTKKAEQNDKKCKTCDKHLKDFYSNKVREELDPFWFERGVKSAKDFNDFLPFWGNRGRRSKMKWATLDDDPPFWGNRGRRDEMEPFWGNRGRRDETEPFWGNRGRRDEVDPFWGNRGKRQDNEPFWGTRGRRKTEDFFSGEDHNKKENDFWSMPDLDSYPSQHESQKSTSKENIFHSMDNIEYGTENLAKMQKAREDSFNSFWNNRGRESTLDSLFNRPLSNRNPLLTNRFFSRRTDNSPSEQKTVLDDRIYAEQPDYILIERSSRSSAEDDPFFISRGKKYTSKLLSSDSIRDRRGVLEELVKSVRNDPYYIARGKKDSEYIKIGNSTILKDEFLKAKDLICSVVDLLIIKNDGHKIKREIDESERDRRTILKKLAAQLQMDPYFVSRGKKNNNTKENEERLEEFINNVNNMCKQVA